MTPKPLPAAGGEAVPGLHAAADDLIAGCHGDARGRQGADGHQ
jgi:hypothetical protein